jgi:hypothetical protein
MRSRRGHFGVVRLCMDKSTGKKYAVKLIAKGGQLDIGRLRMEVDIMKKAGRHPNIVALIDVYEDEGCIYLVMEYCSGGDLLNSIINEGKYSQERAARYLRQMASALKYLHSRGIVHRDLKPENIMLSDNSPDAQIKLVDFGLAAVVQSNQTMRTVCGTWAYYAPELVHHQPYSHTVDIWTLGILMFILLAGYHPFDVHGDAIRAEVLKKIEKAEFNYNDPVWDDVDPEAKAIINQLLQVHSKDRLTLAQFLDKSFVKKGPQRLEAMADIMRRFDRMRTARDTVKVPQMMHFFPALFRVLFAFRTDDAGGRALTIPCLPFSPFFALFSGQASSLCKLRLNRSVRAVYHECVRRRLIVPGQNIVPSRACFAAGKLPAAAFEHPHFVREDLIPLPLPPALPARSVLPLSAKVSSEGLDEMKGVLDAWSDIERESRAKSNLLYNPLARQVFALEADKEVEEQQLLAEQERVQKAAAEKQRAKAELEATKRQELQLAQEQAKQRTQAQKEKKEQKEQVQQQRQQAVKPASAPAPVAMEQMTAAVASVAASQQAAKASAKSSASAAAVAPDVATAATETKRSKKSSAASLDADEAPVATSAPSDRKKSSKAAAAATSATLAASNSSSSPATSDTLEPSKKKKSSSKAATALEMVASNPSTAVSSASASGLDEAEKERKRVKKAAKLAAESEAAAAAAAETSRPSSGTKTKSSKATAGAL